MSNADPSRQRTRPRVVERFASASSRVVGVAGLAVAVLILVDIAVEWRTREGLATAGVLVAIGALIWVGLLRPAVTAREDVLVLRNFLRDTWVPWHLVTEVSRVRGLSVEAEGCTYRSVALAVAGPDQKPVVWSRMRPQSGLTQPSGGRIGHPAAQGSQLEYAARRLAELADEHAAASRTRDRVATTWAWRAPLAFVVGLAVFAAATLA